MLISLLAALVVVILAAIIALTVIRLRRLTYAQQASQQSRDDSSMEVQQKFAELEKSKDEQEALNKAEREKLDRRGQELAALEQNIASEKTELTQQRHAVERQKEEINEREAGLRKDVAHAQVQAEQLENDRKKFVEQTENLEKELSRIAGLSVDEAREELMAQVERDSRRLAAAKAQEIQDKALREAEKIARDTLLTTMQRIAVDETAQAVVSSVALPDDDMKGRIIGREGRNIRAFEEIAGVNVLIDDTPGSVLLSCFDPVRREIARLTMQALVDDGRIHPARIAQIHEQSQSKITELCRTTGEQATTELGLIDVNPGLYEYIGALQFRTSYGQIVLDHIKECGRIAGAIAEEIGLNGDTCKRAAFLHDVGKALVTQGDGSHALEGAKLAKRFGERPEVVNAIAAHHNEVPVESAEAVLTQIADAISSSRPGARRDSLDAYVHRLERLEKIAFSHDGVEQAYAMQAGREVRVMVVPEMVDDQTASELAYQIAHEIEEELTYPGSINVSVVRKSVATSVAH